MEDMHILILDIIITVFGFFVAAPILLNAISTFTVQKRFAQAMIDEGIIDSASVKQIQPKKQIAGVVISILVLAALWLTATKAQPFGAICALFGMVMGFLKYRRILQFNSLTVKRFQNSYKDMYNASKMNQYVDKHF